MAPPDNGRLDWLRDEFRDLRKEMRADREKQDAKLDELRDEQRSHSAECKAGRESHERQLRKLFAGKNGEGIDGLEDLEEAVAAHLKAHGLDAEHDPDPWVANEASQAWHGRKRIAGLMVALLLAVLGLLGQAGAADFLRALARGALR